MPLSTIFQLYGAVSFLVEETGVSRNQRLPGACNRSPGSKLLSRDSKFASIKLLLFLILVFK
jgi:hypothetical protein